MKIRDMTDEQLLAEHENWDRNIRNATSWGAALAAADEFRKECLLEINRRGLTFKEQPNAK